ncbi:leucine-rich repeat-containing protein kinase family protein [Stutzerimonas azotifigens]|uniref:Protein kinase n=1 Tax=Stutzerimonas azotifigens TaxID=291995 RepID=A0ABR5Z479_9GAMM|nr:leucine-rich repeat-containing protein kinase family protein [Stutzerimonas azotifigens]MBA1275039.1 protein kinase [Stutzerimonas azotifigens]
MHTLEQLKRGELAGTTRLDLSAELAEFPPEIFDLADSLEVLNLSGNRLSSLPADLHRLHRLKILFCSHNRFTEVPASVGRCEQLEMVGFKANQISHLPAEALPPRLRWLTLTDNRLEHLPEALGDCERLQKLLLAGNCLQALPASLARCSNLELIRIAANQLTSLPDWLLTMPRLAWLAFAGNPFSDANEAVTLSLHPLPPVSRETITLEEVLGQGASGVIYRAIWQPAGQPARAMAAKLFKGSVTSDGLPHSEMAASIAAGVHPNLVRVTGPLAEGAEEAPGLLLELIEPQFQPLAGPPSLESCTRDCYAQDQRFSLEQTLGIARGVASVTAHLHALGILHGDLYAHNLLVDPAGQCLLSDFGAASFFEPDTVQGLALQRIEARAFGCLLEELLKRTEPADQQARIDALWQLQRRCVAEQSLERPTFEWLSGQLATLELSRQRPKRKRRYTFSASQ